MRRKALDSTLLKELCELNPPDIKTILHTYCTEQAAGKEREMNADAI